MSAQHTQGRLKVGSKVASAIYTDAGHPVCIVDTMGEIPGDSVDKAFARRLVACWDACDGVPTEVLEAQQSGGLPWSVADQIEQRVQFSAYKEGSEEAFGAVVDAKRKAEERASRLEQTIQSQHGVFVKMRAQRDELLAALERTTEMCEQYADWIKRNVMSADIEQHPYLPELEGAAEDARAAIAKVKGGVA